MTIEAISADNIRQLATLMLELWPDTSLEEEFNNCKALLDSKNEICYLAQTASTYIGFIQVAIRSDYVEGSSFSPVAYIEGIYVQDKYRHLGIGKQLIQKAMDWGIQKGCRQIASDTEADNIASIEFHKTAGFTEANRLVCFIKDLWFLKVRPSEHCCNPAGIRITGISRNLHIYLFKLL